MNDREGVTRKGQEYPCRWYDKMMMNDDEFIVQLNVVKHKFPKCTAFIREAFKLYTYIFTPSETKCQFSNYHDTTNHSGYQILHSLRDISKLGECSRGRPEGFLFKSYYTKV